MTDEFKAAEDFIKQIEEAPFQGFQHAREMLVKLAAHHFPAIKKALQIAQGKQK